jgi:hypothetical protein
MRPLAGLIALGAAAVCGAAWAGPTPGPGYAAEVVRMDGAIFSGLTRDGDVLLMTNLADGRLYRWSAKGGFAAFGPSLPHGLDVIGDPTGPYDVARSGNNYLVAQGWTPVDQAPGPHDHALIEVDDSRVVGVVSNDFWNPFRFIAAGQATYVIDAARNSIEKVTSTGERVSIFTFARIRQEGRALKGLSPTEFSGRQTYEFDAVPTGIAAHDGRIYVSLFAGFPFLPGAGKIVSLPESDKASTMRVEREGLNAPVDVAFDVEGRMLVLEHGKYDQAVGFEPESGRLISFDSTGGSPQLLLGGLTRPVSLLALDESRIVVSGLDGSVIFLTKSNAPHQSGQGGTQ